MAAGNVASCRKKSFRIDDLLCQNSSIEHGEKNSASDTVNYSFAESRNNTIPPHLSTEPGLIVKLEQVSSSAGIKLCSESDQNISQSQKFSWDKGTSGLTRYLPKKRHGLQETSDLQIRKDTAQSLPSASSNNSSASSSPSSSPAGFLNAPLFTSVEATKVRAVELPGRQAETSQHFVSHHPRQYPAEMMLSQYPYVNLPALGSVYGPPSSFRPFLPLDYFSGSGDDIRIRNLNHQAAANGILAASVAYLGDNSGGFPFTNVFGFGSSGNKRKGGQIRFTSYQTAQLEKSFKSHKYLNANERKALANSLALSDRQVKTWFQNRRAKWRKSSGVDDSEEYAASPQSDRSFSPDPGSYDDTTTKTMTAETASL